MLTERTTVQSPTERAPAADEKPEGHDTGCAVDPCRGASVVLVSCGRRVAGGEGGGGRQRQLHVGGGGWRGRCTQGHSTGLPLVV